MFTRTLKIALCITMAVFAVSAKGPVNSMDNNSLGLEYSGTFRGQMITEQNVLSYESIQLMSLYFAPVEYVQISLALGADKFETDEFGGRQFVGNYGFSPGAGLSLFTPGFVENILRVTGSFNFLYLNSKDDAGYRYSGPVLNPSLGLMIHPTGILDIEAGVMGHFIVGTMEYSKDDLSSDFSNDQIVRGYLSLSLISPNGVWATLSATASPEAGKDWDGATRPVEASVGLSIGVLLFDEAAGISDDTSRYFPAYKEMKEKQNKMRNDLAE
jgi:hypothetical protein